MLSSLLPRSCSRLSVFVSYSKEQRLLGEEIAQALKNAGHEVFFDIESIPAAGEYNELIHSAIEGSDRFVFLASRASLTPGRFTLTELQFAKERWPSPAGLVLPVIVDEELKLADLPVYLRSVSVMKASGSIAAEVVAAINKTRHIGRLCKTVTALVCAGLIAGGGWLAAGKPGLGKATDVALLPIEVVHFRPAGDPPFPPDAPGASLAWIDTPVSITIAPVSYAHRTEPGRRARILKERVELLLAGVSVPYKAFYVVEITDDRCGDRWFCIKGNAGPETLEPGKTIARETMFHADGGTPPKWGELVDAILTTKDLSLKVVFTSQLDMGVDSGSDGARQIRRVCAIDVAALRQGMVEVGYKSGRSLKPVYLQEKCKVE